MKSNPESSAGDKQNRKKYFNKYTLEVQNKTLPKQMVYLFVLLIFLISQQGFYALLRPKDAKENELNDRCFIAVTFHAV